MEVENMDNKSRPTPQEFFTDLDKRLAGRKENMANFKCIYQFDFAKDNNGCWYLSIDDGKYEIKAERLTKFDVSMVGKYSDFYDIMTGKLNAMFAMVTGRIKTTGDNAKGMKLKKIIEG
jgi:putative sterol carrier protein